MLDLLPAEVIKQIISNQTSFHETLNFVQYSDQVRFAAGSPVSSHWPSIPVDLLSIKFSTLHREQWLSSEFINRTDSAKIEIRIVVRVGGFVRTFEAKFVLFVRTKTNSMPRGSINWAKQQFSNLVLDLSRNSNKSTHRTFRNTFTFPSAQKVIQEMLRFLDFIMQRSHIEVVQLSQLGNPLLWDVLNVVERNSGHFNKLNFNQIYAQCNDDTKLLAVNKCLERLWEVRVDARTFCSCLLLEPIFPNPRHQHIHVTLHDKAENFWKSLPKIRCCNITQTIPHNNPNAARLWIEEVIDLLEAIFEADQPLKMISLNLQLIDMEPGNLHEQLYLPLPPEMKIGENDINAYINVQKHGFIAKMRTATQRWVMQVANVPTTKRVRFVLVDDKYEQIDIFDADLIEQIC